MGLPDESSGAPDASAPDESEAASDGGAETTHGRIRLCDPLPDEALKRCDELDNGVMHICDPLPTGVMSRCDDLDFDDSSDSSCSSSTDSSTEDSEDEHSGKEDDSSDSEPKEKSKKSKTPKDKPAHDQDDSSPDDDEASSPDESSADDSSPDESSGAVGSADAPSPSPGKDQTPLVPFLKLTTPFANDLTIFSFHGDERLSAPFQFTIECRSTKSSLDSKKILGQPVTIQIGIGSAFRYINGVVTRFVQGGTMPDQTVYFLEIRPWFWLLTQTRDSRIFQQKSAPDIIEAVFKAYGFAKFKKSLKATYVVRDYTVQHQESDFDFVSRLMEDEGIFYFFDHTTSEHMLVMADDPSIHKPIPGSAKIGFYGVQKAFADDVVVECTLEKQITTNGYAMGDYNMETPKNVLLTQVKATKKPALAIYEYPGGYIAKSAGGDKIKPRVAGAEEPAASLRGQSRVRGFMPGFKFTLEKHARADINGDYLLRWVSHSGSNDHYTNSFDALPSKTPFRPPQVTAKPRITGTETAVVVGKAGEEIWTDKYGRIKIQFAWDRLGTKNDKSSTWVRVAQNLAGKQWGTWFLPRIGMEVIVTFIDGDPDRPLVTGAVYNSENVVPYKLPAAQTKSTTKTYSSKGGGGFNELRFEDRAGNEEIFMHAQKDMKIKVLHDRTTIIDNSESLQVSNDRDIEVSSGDTYLLVKTGNRKVEIQSNDELKVTGDRKIKIIGDETHENSGDYTHTVKGDYALKVGGAVNIEVDGAMTLKVTGDITVEGDGNITTKSSQAYSTEAGSDMTNKASVGYTIQGTKFDVKASSAGTMDGGGMLTVKGGMVKIN